MALLDALALTFNRPLRVHYSTSKAQQASNASYPTMKFSALSLAALFASASAFSVAPVRRYF